MKPNSEGGFRIRPLRWLALALTVLFADRWLKGRAVKPVEATEAKTTEAKTTEAKTTERSAAPRQRATKPRSSKRKRTVKRTAHTSPHRA
jgi:hypothetical protein